MEGIGIEGTKRCDCGKIIYEKGDYNCSDCIDSIRTTLIHNQESEKEKSEEKE